jgi:tetratricopeptide (TPR) repeat protein
MAWSIGRWALAAACAAALAAVGCAPPDGDVGGTSARHLERARAFAGDGAYDSAVRRYTLALEAGADAATALEERGVARAEQGRHEQAAADLDSALSLRPGDDGILANLAVTRLKLAQWDRALGVLDSLAEMRPDDPKVHYDRARALQGQGRLDRALEELDRALELDPRMGAAYVSRGAIRARRGDLQAAIADFEEAVSLTGSEAARRNLGVARLEAGDPAGAERIFTELLARSPLVARYHLYRGRARRDLGRDGEAAADFRRVLELTGNPGLREQAIDELREMEAGG